MLFKRFYFWNDVPICHESLSYLVSCKTCKVILHLYKMTDSELNYFTIW